MASHGDSESGEWITVVKKQRKPFRVKHINQLILHNTERCKNNNCNNDHCIHAHKDMELTTKHDNIIQTLQRMQKGTRYIIDKNTNGERDEQKITELNKELLFKLLLDNKITCRFREKCKNIDTCDFIHTCRCKEAKCKLLHFTKY